MWKFELSRVALAIISIVCFGCIAWLNVETQRERIQVNTTGVEVMGNVSAKFQTMEPSGRGLSRVNTFRVYYFDEPTEVVGEPLIFEGFGQEFVLSDGRSAVGEFHSYEIKNVPDSLYAQTEEEGEVALLYLPDAPEKVWLKSTLAGKANMDPTLPVAVVLIGLCLALIPLVDWRLIWQKIKISEKM